MILVHDRKLHMPPTRWTQSQTLLAERRIITHSTKIHWRHQNYSNELGCQARASHRWWLECRRSKRFVWFLDRFHSIYSIGRKTSRRICVVRVEIAEQTADIQARLSVARTLGENGKEWQAEGEAIVVTWKAESRRRTNIARDLLTLRTRNSRRPSRMLAKKLETSMNPLCPSKLSRIMNCGSRAPSTVESKLACILKSQCVAHGRIITDHHEDHIAGRGDNSLQHYNLVHKFVLCLKSWKFQQQRQQWTRNGKNCRKNSAWNLTKVQK